MDRVDEAPTKTSGDSLRSLVEAVEVEFLYGDRDSYESAVQALLANLKLDSYSFSIRKATYGPVIPVKESMSPEAIYMAICERKGEELVGASLEITCGHCGQIDKNRLTRSGGQYNSSHIDFLIDNFPPEL